MVWDFNLRPELPNSQWDFYIWQSPHYQIKSSFRGKVVKVHDGDTITMKTEFRDFNFPVRFLGTDAPEMNAGGKEARDWLRGEILGNEVYVIVDPKQRVGKWGRILGKINHGGLDLGEQMLRLGMVTTFEGRRPEEIPNINRELSVSF